MSAFADLIPKNDVAADVIRERDAARASRDAAGLVPRITAQSPDFFSDMLLGAKKRALGLGQLTGLVDEDLGKDLAKQYQQQGEGTGTRGLIGEMLGDPATYALSAFGAPTSLAKMAVMGGAGGLGIGATDPLQQGQDRLTHTLTSAAIGTVAAPAIGKGLQLGGRAVEKSVINPAVDVFKKASQWIKANPNDTIALEIKGMSSVDDVMRAVSGLSDDAKAQFQQATKSGLNPQQAYLATKFAEKGGIMTRGQAAQDPALQRLEDMARMGVLGDDAYQAARNTTDINKNAFRDWSRELLGDVTGNPNAVVDETTTGDIIGGALKRRYAELKAPVDAAYREGGKTKATVAMQHLADFPKQVRQVLDESNISLADTVSFKKDLELLDRLTSKTFTPEKSGAIQSRISTLKGDVNSINDIIAVLQSEIGGKAKLAGNQLGFWRRKTIKSAADDALTLANAKKLLKKTNEQIEKETANLMRGDEYALKSVKWNALEKMAQRMNAKAQWDVPLSTVSDFNRRQDILAYRKLVPELRARQDSLLINNVLTNPDEAAMILRRAPELNKAFRKAFEKKSPAELIATADMTDRQIADFLGRGVIGKGETVNFIKGLKTTLGEQSEEALAPIRGTFLNRIFKNAYDRGDDATFGTAIKSELQKLKSGNKQLYDELFTPDMQQGIEDFANVAWQASNAVKSKTNPPGSGIFNSDMMLSVMRRMGMGGSFAADALGAIGAESGKRLQAKQAIQLMQEPFKAIPSDTKIISGLIAPIMVKQSAPKAASAASLYYGDGNKFMDTEGVTTRIDVNKPSNFDDLIPQSQSSDSIGGGSGNDLLQMASLSPYDTNWQPSPRMLSGEAEYGDRAASGLPMESYSEIENRQAKKPSSFFQKLIMAESSGNPNAKAKTSSASGLAQFTDQTFRNILKKYGKGTGYTMKDKNKPEVQMWALEHLTNENRKALTNTLGREPHDGELYLAHFAGIGGAKRLLKARPTVPAARILPKAAKANKSIFYSNGKPRTVSEVINLLKDKVS